MSDFKSFTLKVATSSERFKAAESPRDVSDRRAGADAPLLPKLSIPSPMLGRNASKLNPSAADDAHCQKSDPPQPSSILPLPDIGAGFSVVTAHAPKTEESDESSAMLSVVVGGTSVPDGGAEPLESLLNRLPIALSSQAVVPTVASSAAISSRFVPL